MLVVVGGHSRNIGKTSVVAGLIRKLRSCQWTAIKITQYGNGVCARDGGACGCEPATGEAIELTEEYQPNKTDSGRFLAGTIRKIVDQSGNVIVESNGIVELVRPDVFLMVLDFSCEDFKPSSLRFMDRADGFVVIDRGINAPLWQDVARGVWDGKPQFLVKPPVYVTAAVADFVKGKLPAAPAPSSASY
jgi:hypothetical protein